MKVKKLISIISIGLISLFFSINLFSEGDYEKRIKIELENIEKKYSKNISEEEKAKLIKERRKIAYSEEDFSIRTYSEIVAGEKLFYESTKSWYNFGNLEAKFSIYLKNKYKLEVNITPIISDNIEIFQNGNNSESDFFEKEDKNRIIETAKLIDLLIKKKYNENFSSFNITKKTKKEYEKQDEKMKKKYDILFDLVKNDIFEYPKIDYSLYGFGKPGGCTLPTPVVPPFSEISNGLPNSQEEWLEFRENEAQMYFLALNKDEDIYYGKLFELTKARTDYLENIIESIQKK